MTVDEFLAFVDKCRARGATHVRAGELTVSFDAPIEPEPEAEKPSTKRVAALNEEERAELIQHRIEAQMREELGQ